HAEIRSTFLPWKKRFFRFCEEIGPIDEELRKGLVDAGLRIVSLIRLHIYKENHVLFKISEASLTKEEKREVVVRMQGIMEGMRNGNKEAPAG
ncbi:MAG TPA: hypothetical protein VFA47_01625, partial [Candidatus Manganitrophaceae bacterium]|nr:hypothetical protein [Candidatus Manganitrophaceae bacterium]